MAQSESLSEVRLPMTSILVHSSKVPEFEHALMSLDEVNLAALVKRIEEYALRTGLISEANLELTVQVFRWTESSSRMQCMIFGTINGKPVNRSISKDVEEFELPPTFWLSPRRIVTAAAIAAVVSKQNSGDLREKWRNAMFDEIEIAARDLLDNSVGSSGSATTKRIRALTVTSKGVGVASAVSFFTGCFIGLSEARIHDRLFTGILYGTAFGGLTGGATFLLCTALLIPTQAIANDPLGRKIMAIIGVQTQGGLRRATVLIGLILLLMAIGLCYGLYIVSRK